MQTTKIRHFSTTSAVASEAASTTQANGDERFKQGWYRYLEEHVEAQYIISFSAALEKQFELCADSPGNRHLKYDLLTLCLRELRAPLTSDYYKTSVLLNLGVEIAKDISTAEKFKSQLNTHLSKHLTQIQRLDIRTKIGEHRQKLERNGWFSVPVMAAYAHFLLLDAQLDLALTVISKARSINAALLYFQVGVSMEAAANEQLANHPKAQYGASSKARGLESAADAALKGQSEFDRIISGNLDEAEQTPTKIIRSEPSVESTSGEDSTSNEAEKLLMTAARMYCRSVAQNPQNTESYTNLAILEFYKRIPTGLAQFEVEAELEAKKVHSKGYNAPVRKYKETPRVSRTVELLEKAIATDTTKANFLADYHLAFVLETEVGDVERARQLYQKALEKNGDSLHSHVHLGALLMEAKQFEKALSHFEQAKLLAKDPEHVLLSFLNLATCHSRLGSIEAAMKEMQRIIRKFPTMPSLHYQLGMILARASRKEEALASFERALQLHSLYPDEPFDPSTTYNVMITLLKELGTAVIRDGETESDFSGGAQFFARCLDLLPDQSSLFPTLLINLSFCFMKCRRPQAALDALEDAFEKSKLSADDFALLFRQIAESDTSEDSAAIVYTQLDQHFTSLEHTDAMISYLMRQLDFVPEDAQRLAPAPAAGDLAKEKKKTKKKIIKKKSKSIKAKKVVKVSEDEEIDLLDSELRGGAMEEGHDMEGEVSPDIEEAIQQQLEENRDDQLKMLMAYKAKLHYNVAFCLNYVGEYEEVKRHLRLAIETDPECSSDYIISDSSKEMDGADADEAGALGDADELGDDMAEDVDIAEQMMAESMGNMQMQNTEGNRETARSIYDRPVHTVGTIRKAASAVPYTTTGMDMQLEQLIHPPDGSKMTNETANLLDFMEQCREKYGHLSIEDLDKKLMKKMNKGDASVRSGKSKRRKQLKYSIEATKRAFRGGPDDGFDSPL